MIFSTGMTDLKATKEALDTIIRQQKDFVALLHCVSLYPPKLHELNLSQINLLKQKFSCVTGYSDHSGMPNIASSAVLAGAEIIECHITLNKYRSGFDHKVSLNPAEFKEMVLSVRNAEQLLGSPELVRSSEVQKTGLKMGRYLATIKAVKKGECLSLENVGFLRFENPVGLVPAKHFNQVLNNKFSRDLSAFCPVALEDLSNA